MRSKAYRALANKVNTFLQKQNPPLNDQAYQFVQLQLGLLVKEVRPPRTDDEEEFIVHSTQNLISKEDARVFFNTAHKNEFVKAFQRKYPELDVSYQSFTDSWYEEAYESFCSYFGIKP